MRLKARVADLSCSGECLGLDILVDLPPVDPKELKEGDTVLIAAKIISDGEDLGYSLWDYAPNKSWKKNIVAVVQEEKEERSCDNCLGIGKDISRDGKCLVTTIGGVICVHWKSKDQGKEDSMCFKNIKRDFCSGLTQEDAFNQLVDLVQQIYRERK